MAPPAAYMAASKEPELSGVSLSISPHGPFIGPPCTCARTPSMYSRVWYTTSSSSVAARAGIGCIRAVMPAPSRNCLVRRVIETDEGCDSGAIEDEAGTVCRHCRYPFWRDGDNPACKTRQCAVFCKHIL